MLNEKLAELYHRGFRTFLSGGALGFDLLAARSVLSLRAVRPDTRLVMVLPCLNQAEKWSAEQRLHYNEILSAADEVIYIAEEYTNGCMHMRNRFMVDNSSVCVCYCTRQRGGTAYTVSYAQGQGLEIHNMIV